MNISDIMTRDVEVVNPNASLQTAAQKMKDLEVGSLPVCDGKRLLGMITDRDITIRATAAGKNPTTTAVNDTMSPGITYCFEDQDVNEAAQVMEEKQIRRLPILNRQKKLVGIVSLGDLAVDGGNRMVAGEAITRISQPSRPER
jgi:CBS domain-containing protein